MGAKIIAKGRPRPADHLTALWDAETAELACLIEAKTLTAIRTAGTSAVAIDRMSRSGPLGVAVLGSGREAATHVSATAAVREIGSPIGLQPGFPVPHWGFERVHPVGMSPELIARMVKEIPNIVCIKAESGMPTPAGFVQTWKNHADEVLVTCPIEADALPFAGLVPLQFMGTSNYECYGNAVLRMFDLVSNGKFNEMMEVYWQIHPARSAYRAVSAAYTAGAGIIHRMVWKYQAWLNGFNGGPLRQPTMKIRDVHMRQLP